MSGKVLSEEEKMVREKRDALDIATQLGYSKKIKGKIMRADSVTQLMNILADGRKQMRD